MLSGLRQRLRSRREPALPNRHGIAFVTHGLSQFDDDLWQLLPADSVEWRFRRYWPCDHIDFLPLFVMCGASIETYATDESSDPNYAYCVMVEDKREFMSRLRNQLPALVRVADDDPVSSL